MIRYIFTASVYWKERCLEQFEIKIDAPDESDDSATKVAVTMLGVEDQIKENLKIKWLDELYTCSECGIKISTPFSNGDGKDRCEYCALEYYYNNRFTPFPVRKVDTVSR